MRERSLEKEAAINNDADLRTLISWTEDRDAFYYLGYL